MWWIVSMTLKGTVFVTVVTTGVTLAKRWWHKDRAEREYDKLHPEPKDSKTGKIIPSATHKGDLTSKKVREIRGYDSAQAWSIDQLLLRKLIQQRGMQKFTYDAISGVDKLKKKVIESKLQNYKGKYSSTFGSSYFGRKVTPLEGIKLFYKIYNERGMCPEAIYTLGGAFVLGAEAARKMSKVGLHGSIHKMLGTQKWTKKTRYDLDTVHGRSFPALSLALGWYNPKKWGHIMDSAITSFRYDKPHGRCKDGEVHILAPSTTFGSSKTIIKIVDTCNFLMMTKEECMSIVFCVLFHWIQKNHSGRKERHSFVEGLQGALMAIGMTEWTINELYIQMMKTLLENELRNPDSYITKVDVKSVESMFEDLDRRRIKGQ